MRRPLLILSLLFLTTSVQNQMIVTGPKMPLSAAAAVYGDSFEFWEYGPVHNAVVDHSEYWTYQGPIE